MYILYSEKKSEHRKRMQLNQKKKKNHYEKCNKATR